MGCARYGVQPFLMVSRADFSGVAAHPYDALGRGKSSDQRVLGGAQSKAEIEFGAVLARQA